MLLSKSRALKLLPNVASRVASAILQFGILVALARAVDISAFGDYATILSVSAIAMSLTGLGISTRVLRISPDEAGDVYRPSMVLTLLGCLGASIIVMIVGFLAFDVGETLVLCAVTFLSSELLGNVLQNWLFGKRADRQAFVYMGVRRAVPLLWIGADLVGILQGDPFVFLAAGYVSTVVITLLWTPTWRLGDLTIASFWRGSRAYWGVSIGAMLQQLDLVVVSRVLGSGPAAGLAAGFRLASPVHIVTTSIVAHMVPRLSSLARTHVQAAARPYLRASSAYAVIVLLLSPATYWLGPQVFGGEFRVYAIAFPLMMANSAFSVINQVIGGLLYVFGEAKVVATRTILSTVIGLSLVTVSSLAGSFVLALLGTLCVQVILSILLIFALFRTKERRIHANGKSRVSGVS